jgi:putative Holliday junction resolvase
MNRPRIVGVDFGRARVGLAVSDPLLHFAQPLDAFPPAEAIRQLEQINGREGISKVILGWPLQLDGSEGEAVEQTKAFETRVRKRLPDVEIVRWDERFSSKEAAAALLASGAKKSVRRKKENVDAMAAAIILQTYLDQ